MEYITQAAKLTYAAGTAGRVAFSPSGAIASEKWKLVAVYLQPCTTTAADPTNYATLTPYVGASSVGTARATTSALTAGTGEAMTITGVGSAIEVTQANEFSVQLTHAASGAAVDCMVIATFEPLRY